MNDWKPKRLDQLGSVARGKSRHRPRNDPVLYGGRWPFFQTGDVKAAELYLHSFSQTYNDAGLAQSKLWPAGTLCITIAANIADTAILGIPGCFPDSVVGFIADPAQSDARFVKYYIETLKQGMQNASRGTTQDNLSVDKLLTFEFLVPSARRQREIASVLSTYDDLIENNTRRIAILEEMARRIYEEWFVRFRFPGHEGAQMVESELGLVPEGWVVAPLGGIAKLLSGFAFKSSTFVENGDYGLVTIKNVHDGVFIENCTSRLSNPPGNMPTHCSLKVADILLSLTGNVGRCCLVTVDGCLLNQRVAKIQPVKAFDWVDLTRFHGRYELLH
jgi:type I restriction enzyme S subunit